MASQNFVDYVKLCCRSGAGGSGSAHLLRDRRTAMGGPDGGDGGRGGHIIVRGNENLWTLHHLKFKKHFKAGHGEHGSSGRSTGADGEDVYVDVPLGTVVRDSESNEILFEITEDEDKRKVLNHSEDSNNVSTDISFGEPKANGLAINA